jgi:hypothetical protein
VAVVVAEVRQARVDEALAVTLARRLVAATQELRVAAAVEAARAGVGRGEAAAVTPGPVATPVQSRA